MSLRVRVTIFTLSRLLCVQTRCFSKRTLASHVLRPFLPHRFCFCCCFLSTSSSSLALSLSLFFLFVPMARELTQQHLRTQVYTRNDRYAMQYIRIHTNLIVYTDFRCYKMANELCTLVGHITQDYSDGLHVRISRIYNRRLNSRSFLPRLI